MTEKELTMTTPELRLSPDGTQIAHHWNPESPWSWNWVTVSGPLRSGAHRAATVADWIPLVSAPAAADRDAAVRTALGLHSEHTIWEPCGHQHAADEPGVTEVPDVGFVCGDGFLKSLCAECCTDPGFGQTERCASSHDGPCFPCRTREALEAAVPAVPAADDQDLVDEATASHLAAVILADLDDEHDPESPAHPERIAGYAAGMRRAAELVCESSSITHTVPAADELGADFISFGGQFVEHDVPEHEVRHVAQAIHAEKCGCDDWSIHGMPGEVDNPEYLAMARAAIAALREVPRG